MMPLPFAVGLETREKSVFAGDDDGERGCVRPTEIARVRTQTRKRSRRKRGRERRTKEEEEEEEEEEEKGRKEPSERAYGKERNSVLDRIKNQLSVSRAQSAARYRHLFASAVLISLTD
jgi:uncharacterized membrane protein YdbT with pleckstrin-like domain